MSDYVVKRNGSRQPVHFDKITYRVNRLREGYIGVKKCMQSLDNVNTISITKQVVPRLISGMKTCELDTYTSQVCASMNTEHFEYGQLAGRIEVSNLHKNTLSSFSDTVRMLYDNHDAFKKHVPLVNRDFYKLVQKHGPLIDQMIDHERDYRLDYFGFKTLESSYLLKSKTQNYVCERPQYLYMRMALCFYSQTIDFQKIKETYDCLSLGQYSHATPTMYNAGSVYQQLSSCFLLGIEDSMDAPGGIPDCWRACAMISKRAGGIGITLSPLRSRGSLIRGTNGQCNGIIPVCRVFNDIACYVNQGGKRPGAIAVYKEPWDADIFDFIRLKRNTGIEQERARDLFFGLWIPDEFMRRVRSAYFDNKVVMWSLMCSDECPGLVQSYGEEFTLLYTKYEKEGRVKTQIDIKTLWQEILKSQKETGTPYMLYKDHINMKNNQCNLGTITHSNLCTEIMEFSSSEEYAVCNLASINLEAFIGGGAKESALIFENPSETSSNPLVAGLGGACLGNNPEDPPYNYDELIRVARIAMRNLNMIIDINEYPVPQTRRSNMRHRPVGLGVQGLADTFLSLGLVFDSVEARDINKRIFECIYYACIYESTVIAEERTEGMRKLLLPGQILTYYDSTPDAWAIPLGDNGDLIAALKPTRYEIENLSHIWPGAYASFEGSPASKGLLQYDLWGVKPSEGGFLDWDGLKERVKKWGLRNSLTTAVMPTATTAQILGNVECIEPFKYNIFTRRVSAGEFVVVNKFLHKELVEKNMWTKEIKKALIRDRGSVQNLDISAEMKLKYRTAYEISAKSLLEMAADRSPFIDQSSSQNSFIASPNDRILTNLHIKGWELGLKTGMYYLRREPVIDAIQFTVTPNGDIALGVKGSVAPSEETKETLVFTAIEECTSCSA